MFGANAGGNDLALQSNAYIAALFQSDFVVKGVKLDAQVLATDNQAINGLLYNGNAARRNEANAVYSALNQAGSVS